MALQLVLWLDAEAEIEALLERRSLYSEDYKAMDDNPDDEGDDILD